MSPLGSGGTILRAQDLSIDGLRYLSKQLFMMHNRIEDCALADTPQLWITLGSN